MIDQTCTQPFGPGELEQALERFDWLVEEMRDKVCGADVTVMQNVLSDPDRRTAEKERALVCLGLLASAEAHAALCWFDPSGEHRRVRLLHRLAKRACSRRRQMRPAARRCIAKAA